MIYHRRLPPGQCPHCSNSMNWGCEWGNLWRCGGCGRITTNGSEPSTRQVVEDAIRASKNPHMSWEGP